MTERSRAYASLPLSRCVSLWLLFFLVCAGLGYPTLNRYDPRQSNTDSATYYRIVTNEALPDEIPFRSRVLVPFVAKPFYALARGRAGSWNPVFFGLLISNSLFCATTAFLLALTGYRALGDLPVALLGSSLYLLNFAVPTFQLAALVDSSEACLMMAIAWCLTTDRWWPLPILGVLGGLAKQSFVPFSTLFAAVWWFTAERPRGTYRRILWVAALGVTSTTTMVLACRATGGQLLSPWAMAKWWDSGSNYVLNPAQCFTDRNFWYVFVWLLPLGIWRLHRLPRPWVMASLAAALFAFGLGSYTDLVSNVNRPLFSLAGPVLSLSVASLLASGRSSSEAPLVRKPQLPSS